MPEGPFCLASRLLNGNILDRDGLCDLMTTGDPVLQAPVMIIPHRHVATPFEATIALATRKFGIGQAALVYGWIFAAHQLGAAAAAWIAGLLRTSEGDYVLAFTGAGYLSLVAAGLVLAIGRGSVRRRPAPVSLAPAGSD